MKSETRIELAQVKDAQEIFALYHGLIDMPYSTWDEEYPTMEIVEEDLQHHHVLAMKDESGAIISAIAVWFEMEFADAAPWYADVKQWCMFCRLGVHRDHQGRGIAKRMLTAAMEFGRAHGCDAVQFLVAKSNPIAQRAYAPLGFEVCGEAELWEPGEVWLCYQKRL